MSKAIELNITVNPDWTLVAINAETGKEYKIREVTGMSVNVEMAIKAAVEKAMAEFKATQKVVTPAAEVPVCAECGARLVTIAQAKFSMNKFGRHLCSKCQAKAQPAEGNHAAPASKELSEVKCRKCGATLTVGVAKYCADHREELKGYDLCPACQNLYWKWVRDQKAKEQPAAEQPKLVVHPEAKCEKCGKPLSAGVAKFCRTSKKLGGHMLCMDCQPKDAPAQAPAKEEKVPVAANKANNDEPIGLYLLNDDVDVDENGQPFNN